jgi:DNA (cytosine-5)-methyltransferase 1
MKLRVLDLFSGIGGFSLGLERATYEGGQYDGFETVAFCEIEEFPRKVLAKHWPDVPCYTDVRELTAERLAADGIAVDVICGGFPCQDISFAGLGAGLAGARSGLFYQIARLAGELGPRFIILENVGALLSRGLDAVLGTLASLGYDAEWHCIPASAVGAPHRRDRVWIVAYARHNGHRPDNRSCEDTGAAGQGAGVSEEREWLWGVAGRGGEIMADAMRWGRQGQGQPIQPCDPAPVITRQTVDAFNGRVGDIWRAEPNVGRVANGVPDRAHRLKALGNAVVPAIPQLLGQAILQSIGRAA